MSGEDELLKKANVTNITSIHRLLEFVMHMSLSTSLRLKNRALDFLVFSFGGMVAHQM